VKVQQLGHVVLKVRERERSERFYTEVLGLQIAARRDTPPMTFFTLVSGAAGPDQLSARALRDGRHFALRWVLLHLIEETARHAGHADFLREAIDGTVGE
jgi:catechol 2,3-dioxygenase-like lactoylglutathione lyase family enzyme